MTEPTSDEPDGNRPTDADRLRRMRRILTAGVVLGVLLVVAAGVGGAEGRDGAAVLLLILAGTTAIVGIYGGVTLLRDDLRSSPISGRRIGFTIGSFLTTALLMAMVAGIGG